MALNEPKFCRLLGFSSIKKNVNNKIWLCSTVQYAINVLVDDEQFLHCEIKSLSTGSIFLATWIYAKCSRRERRILWEKVTCLAPSSSTPWCIGGDFNIITSPEERAGGALPDSNAMADFGNFILNNGFIDLGFLGNLLGKGMMA